MRNRQEEINQMVKAYLKRGNNETAFWCRDTVSKNIGLEIGQPFHDGQRVLITESPLEFRLNDTVKVLGDELLIEDVQQVMKANRNAMRNAPSYVKTLVVK
jgi:hypothetical protein